MCVGVAVQLFTLGIPCIYYGTEQAFAGPAHSQLRWLTGEGWGGGDHADRYLREAMFGPDHPRAGHDQPLPHQVADVVAGQDPRCATAAATTEPCGDGVCDGRTRSGAS